MLWNRYHFWFLCSFQVKSHLHIPQLQPYVERLLNPASLVLIKGPCDAKLALETICIGWCVTFNKPFSSRKEFTIYKHNHIKQLSQNRKQKIYSWTKTCLILCLSHPCGSGSQLERIWSTRIWRRKEEELWNSSCLFLSSPHIYFWTVTHLFFPSLVRSCPVAFLSHTGCVTVLLRAEKSRGPSETN